MSSPQSRRSNDMPTGTETLLIVEDDPQVREVTAILLRMQGYTVLEADNGVDALELAKEFRGDSIDLVLADVNMPEMGGRELAHHIRMRYPNSKVMYTSGQPDDLTVTGKAQDNEVGYLQKPWTASELARAIRHALDDIPT